MPFKSKAQMRFLQEKHPETAKKWAEKFKVPKNLPETVGMKPAPEKPDTLTEYLNKSGKKD